jgi:hypothetical protein
MSIDELFQLKDRYQADFDAEVKKAAIKNGKSSRTTILTKFTTSNTNNPTSYT